MSSSTTSTTSLAPDINQENDNNQSESQRIRTQSLSPKQERKLIDFIEDKFLDVTRNFKKRSHPSSKLPTLKDYLDAVHTLLALILQIPPIASSQAALRTAFLLRLTGEVLTSIAGYAPIPDTLPQLLTLLNELDRGWCAVLRAQAWDPDIRTGVDVEITLPAPGPSNGHGGGHSDAQNEMDVSFSLLGAPPVSQTDRTRLRSILASGTARLEEWLEKGLHVDGTDDLEQALERLGMQQAFDDLFVETLSEMGEFTEEMSQMDVPPLLSDC